MIITDTLYNYFSDIIYVTENPCKIKIRNILKSGDDIKIEDVEESYVLDKIHFDSKMPIDLLIISQIIEKSKKIDFNYFSQNFIKSIFINKDKSLKKVIDKVNKDFTSDFIITNSNFSKIADSETIILDELKTVIILGKKEKMIIKNTPDNSLEFYINYNNFFIINLS